MNRLCFAAAALLALAAPRPTLAQSALFPRRAELDVPAHDGLVRVELPSEIVAACGSSLGDLRVIDEYGFVPPYVIDGAPPAGEQATAIAMTPAEARQLVDSPAGATPRYEEQYELDLPSVPPPGGTWSLALATENPHFTAEARLEHLGADGSAEPLTARTVFRLPAGSERLEIMLPRGTTGRIRVHISGEQGFLSPTFEARSVAPGVEPTFLSLELPIESVEHEDGRTVLVARRPLALVPSALVLSTSETTVQRYVRVVDAGANGTQAVVGEGLVSRVAGAGAAAELVVPLDGAGGDRLRVEILDEGGEPLRDLRVEARIQEPSVVFDASRTYRPVWIYFGGARVLPPRSPEADALLRASREGPPPLPATIVRIDDNPGYAAGPALAFAMRPGPALELGAYAHQASVTIPESPEGLVRIVVPATVAARIDPESRDLRLVDGEGRQWPYITGFEPHREKTRLGLERTEPRPRASRYALTLPKGPADVVGLELRVEAEHVDRPYRLYAPAPSEGGDERLLSSGQLRRRPGDPDVLRVALYDERLERLFLEVDDGDDAPLSLRASAEVELPVLYAAAARGEYRLLFGVPEGVEGVGPPSYELEAERDLVLAVQAVDARVGAVERNPQFTPPSPYSASRLGDIALWGVLGLAVFVLGALTFRLARLAPPPAAANEAAGGPAAPPREGDSGPSGDGDGDGDVNGDGDGDVNGDLPKETEDP